MAAKSTYTSDQIQVLEGLEPVRKRPGMYIGSTGQEGLHHLITEIVNNSMDEAIAGYCNHVKLEFFEDGSVAVYDNGRGIPYDIKKEYGVSALELAFTKLHAGGKFGGGGYKVSSGLHGVGASVVNALSKWCRVIVKRGDELVMQEYQDGGKVLGPVAKLDFKNPKTKVKGAEWNIDLTTWNHESGTIVQFLPDDTIFETVNFHNNFFINQLREYAYLTAGIKFEIEDHRHDLARMFYFEGGIKSYLLSLNRNKTVLNQTPFYVKKDIDEVSVEVAFQYNDSFSENVVCFANHLKNSEGGTHLTGFRTALTRVINEYARSNNYLKEKDAGLTGDDLREGLAAIISVNLDSATLQFEGQTKAKLGNTNVRQAVETVVKEALESYLQENPRDAGAIIEKNVLALKARMAAKAARDTVIRKTALEGGGVLPGKLADCSSKDKQKTELFILEGDSAGGSAKQARDRKHQAVLPLKGKILNVEKARFDKMLSSAEVGTLITALGCGIGRDEYSPDKLRYHSIIIMTDADVDGSHIRTLLLTFFFRQMPELIERGNIYIAQPPLFKVTKSKKERYVKDELALDEMLTQSALDNVVFYPGGGSQLTGEPLAQLVNEYNAVKMIVKRYSKRYPKDFLEALVYAPQMNDAVLVQKNEMETIVKDIQDRLNIENSMHAYFEIDLAHDSERNWWMPKVNMTSHGVLHTILINKDLFFSPDYRKMTEFGTKVKAMLRADAYVERDGKKHAIQTFDQAMQWLITEAKKGQSIQRYKGLGEMNPDQLWETTMDPARRCLLQVRVEDAVAADQIFTTLMGDEVEPRRQFIESNALEVNNLDI